MHPHVAPQRKPRAYETRTMSNQTKNPGPGRGQSAVFTVILPPVPVPKHEGALEPLLTEKQVAAYLSLTTRHLYSWRMAGFIPYYKIGRAIRFRLSEVEKALEAMRVQP